MADISIEMSTDFSKLKVPDLKKELKQRGLSTTGNKNELLERLQTSLKANDIVGSESVDDLEEDLLNDDDDEHLDANEAAILEKELDESPNPVKRKLIETTDETNIEPPKKVILNRNMSINTDIVLKSEDKLEEKKPEETDEEKEEKKVIKLSQLSAKERLEMRAKKFGVTSINPDAMKAVRAERFGAGNTNNSANSITSSNVVTSVDKLKQRAERFGGSVSTVMSNLENREKLEKRKERFGSSTNGVGTADEKAKLRLERFKQPVK